MVHGDYIKEDASEAVLQPPDSSQADERHGCVILLDYRGVALVVVDVLDYDIVILLRFLDQENLEINCVDQVV